MTADRVATRTRWFVLALSPVLAIRIGQSPLRFTALLCVSLLLTAALGLLAQSLRRQPLRQAWMDEANWATALLLPLWFGAALSPGWLALALVVAQASRLPFGGMGTQVFHPAMVGAALLPIIGASDGSYPGGMSTNLACAFAAVLLAGRVRRDLRAPIALVLSFTAAEALLQAAGLAPTASIDRTQLALAAALVANDPVTTPMQSAARIAFGFGAGLAAALLPGSAAALPCSLLAMQAATPWLDRAAGWRHVAIKFVASSTEASSTDASRPDASSTDATRSAA